jgi:NAD(P)-dependent dehydrogenase (short-subunit alcohol dehydrogenase family)
MGEVRSLADRLLKALPAIHVLVNNAGALFPERDVTAEGIERTLALNLASPFLLTTMLIPRLIESAPSRIITVSSGGMYTQGISLRDLQSERPPYRGTIAYARAKRGQVVLTEMWAEELEGTGVVAHAMHPGWVNTPGVDASLPRFRRVVGPLLRTPVQGADTIVWLGASSEAAETSGSFWMDRRARPTVYLEKTRTSEKKRRELRARLEELTGPAG